MPRSRLDERRLPPAVITDDLLRLIDEAIPKPLKGHATWYVNLGDYTVYESDVESLLSEIAKETRFNEVTLELLDDDDTDYSFSFWCYDDSAGVSYNIPESRDMHFRALADTIERESSSATNVSCRLYGGHPSFASAMSPLPCCLN